jgi:hypothetical protein
MPILVPKMPRLGERWTMVLCGNDTRAPEKKAYNSEITITPMAFRGPVRSAM